MFLGHRVIVYSFPNPGNFPPRAGFITAEYDESQVDVSIFNPYSEGPASVREASMPVIQAMGPILLVDDLANIPAAHKARWVAVHQGVMAVAVVPDTKPVAKPKPAAPAKR